MPTISGNFKKQGGRVTGGKCKAQKMKKGKSPKYFVRYVYSSTYQSDIYF